METQVMHDLHAAKEICSAYGRLQCVEAVKEMLRTFGTDMKIIHINLEDRAISEYIVKTDARDEVVTQAHNHYASFIHKKVFDNEFPNGQPLTQWLSSYMYMSKEGKKTVLNEHDIVWLTKEQFNERME